MIQCCTQTLCPRATRLHIDQDRTLGGLSVCATNSSNLSTLSNPYHHHHLLFSYPHSKNSPMATAKTAQQSGAAQPQQPQQQQQSLPGLDKNMAVRCVEHAQTYWEILEALPSTKVHLTRVDDDLYHDFCQAFPEFVVPQQEEESGSSTPVDPVTKITEQQVKSAELQPRWHTLATQYQDKSTFLSNIHLFLHSLFVHVPDINHYSYCPASRLVARGSGMSGGQ